MKTSAITMLVAAALLGCGEDGARRAAAAKPAAAKAAAALPADLVGTWTMRLPVSELPDPPNELNEAASGWELKILADGGIDGAPSLTLANASEAVGAIASPAVTAEGDRLRLRAEDCRAQPTEYLYAVDGDRLTLQPKDTRGCPDPLIEALLSTKPWRRAG